VLRLKNAWNSLSVMAMRKKMGEKDAAKIQKNFWQLCTNPVGGKNVCVQQLVKKTDKPTSVISSLWKKLNPVKK
jgi:hypothetical protein